MRDLLHSHFPESHNKTSRACQRRLNYMLKNKTTLDNVSLFLAEVQQDQQVLKHNSLLFFKKCKNEPSQIVSRFPSPSASQTLSREENEARLKQHFDDLVSVLLDKYRGGSRVGDALHLPDDIEEILRQYEVVHPLANMGGTTGKDSFFFDLFSVLISFCFPGFVEPKDVSEIRGSVINALITSSLCSASDKTSWAFQLFKIYQQYPDSLLRTVMTKLRTDRMVNVL